MTWQEVEASSHEWDTLLLGNGLSINVWKPFAYDELFEYAEDGGLTDEDLALFDATPNFERVLADLNSAVRVLELLDMDATPLYERYRSIQLALGHAIREVHLRRSHVPDETLATIRGVLLDFEWVFTTSYDLLIYWAMGYDDYQPFIDHFRWEGRCQFDPERALVHEGEVPVYFLHGALHLVVGGNGETWKLTRGLQTLLDQFGQEIQGDPRARPLLVTEGSAQDKLVAIESNEYLGHSLRRLRGRSEPVVVFGSGLGEQDDHLVRALSEHPDRATAVSMRNRGTKAARAKTQTDLFARLGTDNLYFFDAETHPLGSPDLRVREET